MKMTSEEFDKAVTRREVKSAEFVSLLADSLRELAAPGVEAGKGTVDNAWNRLMLSITEVSSVLFQGWKPAMISAILIVKDLVDDLEILVWAVSSVGKVLGLFLSIARVLTALIGDLLNTTRRNKLLKYAFGDSLPEFMKPNQSKQVVEHKVVVSASEQAKKDLELKIEQQQKSWWDGFSMGIQ